MNVEDLRQEACQVELSTLVHFGFDRRCLSTVENVLNVDCQFFCHHGAEEMNLPVKHIWLNTLV